VNATWVMGVVNVAVFSCNVHCIML